MTFDYQMKTIITAICLVLITSCASHNQVRRAPEWMPLFSAGMTVDEVKAILETNGTLTKFEEHPIEWITKESINRQITPEKRNITQFIIFAEIDYEWIYADWFYFLFDDDGKLIELYMYEWI